MAEIRIETKPVVIGWDQGYDHSYLVFVDDDGFETTIRAGVTYGIPPYGPLDVKVGAALADTLDARDISEREARGSTVIYLGGRDALAVWQSMLQAAQTIQDEPLGYDLEPTAQNSNSVVAAVLQRVGIEMSDYFPLTSDPDEFHLGWDHSLEQVAYTIVSPKAADGSEIESDDILFGGKRDDTLIGGLGADELIGRAGNDSLYAFLQGAGYELLYGPGPVSDEVRDTLKGGDGFDDYYIAEHYNDYDVSYVEGLSDASGLEYDQIVLLADVGNAGGYSQSIDFSIFDDVDVIDDADQAGALYFYDFGSDEYLHIHFTSSYGNIAGDTVYATDLMGDWQNGVDSYFIEGIVHQGDLYIYRIDDRFEYAAGISAEWMGIDAVAVVKNYTLGDLSLWGDLGDGPGPIDPDPTNPDYTFHPDFPDVADYSLSAEGVTLDLETDTATGGSAEGDNIVAANHVIGSAYGDALTGDSNDNDLEGEGGNDNIDGAGGDDWIKAGSGEDVINGGAGSDIIQGNAGHDQLTGGLDRDFLFGGNGDDSYFYAAGDGDDIIEDESGIDSLFLSGILPADITLTKVAPDTLEISHNGETITVVGYFTAETTIENIVFDDGTIWDVAYVTSAYTNNAPSIGNEIPNSTSAEETAVSFAIAADAFSDIDGDTLTLTALLSGGSSLPAWLSFDPSTRTFSGTPPQDFNGTMGVVVTASDGISSASDEFFLTITGVNDAPVVATPIADKPSLKNTVVNFVVPADTFSDVDGDVPTLTATLSDDSTLPAWLTFDSTTQTFSGTPPLDYVGSLDVKVTASDGEYSVADTFALNIVGSNNAPVIATPLADQSSAEDTAVNFEIPVDAFSDVDGHALTLSATLSDGSSLPAWLSFDPSTRTFLGTPPLNFIGSLDVRVTASDGIDGVSDTFELTVTAVNDDPSAVDDSTNAENGGAVIVMVAASLLANDTDVENDTLSILSVQDAVQGSVALNANGDVEFTPNAGYFGSASFTYTVTDGTAQNTATVVLELQQPNGSPNVINGTGNADVIAGTSGDDMIEGGLGNDKSQGEDGSDTYVFNAGDGQDVIDDNGSNDTDKLVIHGYTPAETNFAKVAASTLIVTFNGSTDQITIVNTLSGGEDDQIEQIVFDDGTVMSMSDINAIISGQSPAPNSITGTIGSDSLTGTNSDETFDGDAGDDTLAGGYGHDTYLYGEGSGHDVINEHSASSAYDVLQLIGLNQSDVTFSRSMTDINDVIVTINSSGETVTLDNQQNYKDGVEKIVFADGSVLGSDDWSIDGLLYGMAPILGTDGDDTLSGANSDDIFDGGAGNDTIAGNYGHDTYLFGVGSGHDFVDEKSSSNAYDVLKLIGLNQSDVTFTRPMTSTNDLVVMINATGETITFGDQFNNKDGIEKIEFADGSVMGANDFSFDGIMAGLAPITGTAVGDNIVGTNADELFDGGAGNDTLAGGYGHDTYLFGVGSGHDIVDEHSSSNAFDVLKLVGLNQSDVTFSRPWTDVNDIVVTIEATGETMTLDNQLNQKDGVEKIIFDDGTVLGADDWSLDAQIRPLGPVSGSGGNDTISGTSSSEPLFGGGGDDTQSGGGGDDTFIFAADFGNDTITDFAAGASTDDVIEFRSVTGFASYADVLANTVDNGTNATITLDADNSIVLQNVLVSDLSTDDFRFV